jgi:5-formaminoimidazole-4-carboxamide-1-(beta)-D-ribofuranosyl 5'-monophosphate synthetase
MAKILSDYDLDNVTIGTLGSHSALNIFKGAKEEGFKTVSICKKEDTIIYKKFPLADEIIVVKSFTELLDEKLQQRLR